MIAVTGTMSKAPINLNAEPIISNINSVETG